MKKLGSLLVIVLFAFCANAQQTVTAAAPAGNTSVAPNSGNGSGATSVTGGKVAIPAEKARPITIPKMSNAVTVDGRPDEDAWKSAAVFKDFYQTGPGYNTAPSRPTEVLVMYDEKNFYVAFKCWDERDKIRATVAKRDNVFGEDNVRMWLDTYDDRRRAYVLGFNPLGIQQDGIYTEGTGADFSVDIVMESKGVIEDWGWSVEVKIPFKSLRYAAGKGKAWGFNVARNIDRFNDEFDQWLPDDRDVSGFLIKHGKITGLDEIKYERTLEIVPSITVSETGQRKRTLPLAAYEQFGVFDPIFNPIGIRDPGKFTNDPVKKDIGVNLKYTISPNVTLDAAINPDYAEIEADAPVVAANQRFPIFFAEKRPFFLEGKDIFETPLQPFYSRRIVDPDVALKLSGKSGKNTFGLIAASDNFPGHDFDRADLDQLQICQEGRAFDMEHNVTNPRSCSSIEPFVGKNATYGVLRVKHDFGKENNIGFFATARSFPRNRNFLFGFDGKMKFNPKTVMTFQALETYSKKRFYDPIIDRVDYRVGNGFGYFWSLDYTADTHGWYAELKGRTSNYRADAGFTQRVDSNDAFFINRLSTKSHPKSQLIRADWKQFVRHTFDWKGRVQNLLIGTSFNLAMQGNLFINGETGYAHEKDYEEEFGAKRNPAEGIVGAFVGAPTRSADQPYFSLNINKRINKQLFVYGFVGSIFNAFDYDFGAGSRFPRASGAFQNYLRSPEYLDYIHQLYLYQANPQSNTYPDFVPPPNFDLGKGWQFDANGGVEYKPVDPFVISLDYTKSRLRRHDTGLLAYDTNIFSLRSTYSFTRFTFLRARWDYDTLNADASGQFLLGWNPNPGTAFYVGYNDTFNYNGFNPFTNQSENGFGRNSRTFFIRASYLFRKSF
jgi:Domain of unknown function (DUF5916)/Carbohydrate family 9 binding domain-like